MTNESLGRVKRLLVKVSTLHGSAFLWTFKNNVCIPTRTQWWSQKFPDGGERTRNHGKKGPKKWHFLHTALIRETSSYDQFPKRSK